MTIKKNICIAINSLGGGGTEKQCLLLAKSLQDSHNITVIVTKPLPIFPRYKEEIKESNISVSVLEGGYLKRVNDFTKFLKSNEIEIVFSYLPSDITIAAICGKLAGVPYIIGGIRNDRIPKLKFILLRFLHNRMVHFSISNSFGASDFFSQKGFNSKKILVIPNGIVIDEMPMRRSDKKQVIITSLGRFVKQKDYETALRSIVYLKEELGLKKQIKYRIMGHGPEQQQIEDLVTQYALAKEVEILVEPDNPLELLRQSDIYLCSSIHEGISNSIMEAMSCSLPVVATGVGDNNRLVLDGESGWIVNPKDHLEMAQCLYKLICSVEDRNRMGIKGHQHLSTCYGEDRFKEQYLKLIAEMDQLQIVNGTYHFGPHG